MLLFFFSPASFSFFSYFCISLSFFFSLLFISSFFVSIYSSFTSFPKHLPTLPSLSSFYSRNSGGITSFSIPPPTTTTATKNKMMMKRKKSLLGSLQPNTQDRHVVLLIRLKIKANEIFKTNDLRLFSDECDTTFVLWREINSQWVSGKGRDSLRTSQM